MDANHHAHLLAAGYFLANEGEETWRLANDFLDALAADFSENGQEALARMRETSPAAYIKAIAMLMPRDIHLRHTIEAEIEGLTDDELHRHVEELERPTIVAMTDAEFDAHLAKLATWRGQTIITQPYLEAPAPSTDGRSK